jgi:hypothetical protein
MVTLVEYPYREYAGNQRLVFSRRAAYAKFTRAFRTGLAGGILAEFRFAGEARTNNTLDTSSLALQYNHGLPRPIYWVLWLWQRLRGEVLVNDKSVLLLRHQGYQLLLRNVVVFNPLLSSEEAFIQRFQQQYHLQLQGMRGEWRIRRHLSIGTMVRSTRCWKGYAATAGLMKRCGAGLRTKRVQRFPYAMNGLMTAGK